MNKTLFGANIRIVVRVPFEFDNEVMEDGTSEDRRNAAIYAETVLMDKVKKALSSEGEVLEKLCLVEEVSEENDWVG